MLTDNDSVAVVGYMKCLAIPTGNIYEFVAKNAMSKTVLKVTVPKVLISFYLLFCAKDACAFGANLFKRRSRPTSSRSRLDKIETDCTGSSIRSMIKSGISRNPLARGRIYPTINQRILS